RIAPPRCAASGTATHVPISARIELIRWVMLLKRSPGYMCCAHPERSEGSFITPAGFRPWALACRCDERSFVASLLRIYSSKRHFVLILGRPAGGRRGRTPRAVAAALFAVAFAIEHLHLAGDDLGAIALLAGLLVLP